MRWINRLDQNPLVRLTGHLLPPPDLPPPGCLAGVQQAFFVRVIPLLRWIAIGLLLLQIPLVLFRGLPHLPTDLLAIRSGIALVSGVIGTSALVAHFRLVNQTSWSAALAIQRSKRSPERWQALVLTGMDARTLVRGVWWAIVRRFWREWLRWGVTRAGLISGAIVAGDLVSSYPYAYRPAHLWILLLLANGLVVLLTLANLPYTAAIGVLNAMLFPRGGQPGSEIGLRVVGLGCAGIVLTLIGISLMALFRGARLFVEVSAGIFSAIAIAIWIIADNGLVLGMQLSLSGMAITAGTAVSLTVFAGGGALLLYAALTWGMLRWAEWSGVQYGLIRVDEKRGITKRALD